MGFTFGFASPVIIETGIRLGIFDLLDKGARSIGEIASSSGASARGLRIVLNASMGTSPIPRNMCLVLIPDEVPAAAVSAWFPSRPCQARSSAAAPGTG